MFTAAGRNQELTCGTLTPVAGRLIDENLGGPRLMEKLLEKVEVKAGDWKVDWKVDENGAGDFWCFGLADRFEKPFDSSSTAGVDDCSIVRCAKVECCHAAGCLLIVRSKVADSKVLGRGDVGGGWSDGSLGRGPMLLFF
jgi:hypothetical protein